MGTRHFRPDPWRWPRKACSASCWRSGRRPRQLGQLVQNASWVGYPTSEKNGETPELGCSKLTQTDEMLHWPDHEFLDKIIQRLGYWTQILSHIQMFQVWTGIIFRASRHPFFQGWALEETSTRLGKNFTPYHPRNPSIFINLGGVICFKMFQVSTLDVKRRWVETAKGPRSACNSRWEFLVGSNRIWVDRCRPSMLHLPLGASTYPPIIKRGKGKSCVYWLVVDLPLWKICVNGEDYPIYIYGKS